MNRPPCVIDNGTGYSKMGYAGNIHPNFIVPSLISVAAEGKTSSSDVADLDFFIGAEATQKRENYNVDYPIRHGIVSNWDNMERYWQRCIYQYLRVDPEEHIIMLTEPPMNTPENREYTAEIMFETFNVPAMYIAVQAVLALYASIYANPGDRKGKDAKRMTGTVIDSGDGATHIIPVVDGYVIGSRIKHIPLAGRDVTDFIVQMLRDRGENLPANQALDVARTIKEKWCYICKDVAKEYQKYDSDNTKFQLYEGKDLRTKKPFTIDVGYERFLGPEVFFSPEIYSAQHATPLPTLVDDVILKCPMDCRRPLFEYITLSGGSTMFKHFTKRLELEIKRRVKGRAKKQFERVGVQGKKIKVKVISHDFQRFAVWFGGSIMAIQPGFINMCHTRERYNEVGPSVARQNAALNTA